MIQLVELKKNVGGKKKGDRVRARTETLDALGLKPGVDYRPLGTDPNARAKLDLKPPPNPSGSKPPRK